MSISYIAFPGLQPYSDECIANSAIEIVSKYYSISYEEMYARTRTAKILFARHVAIYLIRANTKYTLTYIGSLFNLKDHSSVYNAIKSIKNYMFYDGEIKRQVLNFSEQL